MRQIVSKVKKSAKFRGVWMVKNKKEKPWKATIYYKKEEKHLGYFDTIEEAAIAYDEGSIRYYGDNGYLNFPIEPKIIIPGTRWLKLTQRKWALIDECDYENANQYTWHVIKSTKNSTLYAQRNYSDENGIYRTQTLHVFLMGKTDNGFEIDHIDHNGLNDRRNNLRVCTIVQNKANMKPKLGGTSDFKGVCWSERDHVFVAKRHVSGRCTNLGSFNNEIDAAKAYDKSAVSEWGDHACINFPEDYPEVFVNRSSQCRIQIY